MGKRKYNIEDLYDVDVNKFIKIFETSPYNPKLDNMGKGNFYYSKVFHSLPIEEQLELFEVYLLKYFYYIYSNDIKNTDSHTGDTSLGLDLYFSEISTTISVPIFSDKTDFVLTLEFYESRDDDEERQVSDFSLWIDDPVSDGSRSEIGFSWEGLTSMYDAQRAREISHDVFDALKRVYEQLAQEDELVAWYILNGIDLKHLLLQDDVKYNGWSLAEKLMEGVTDHGHKK